MSPVDYINGQKPLLIEGLKKSGYAKQSLFCFVENGVGLIFDFAKNEAGGWLAVICSSDQQYVADSATEYTAAELKPHYLRIKECAVRHNVKEEIERQGGDCMNAHKFVTEWVEVAQQNMAREGFTKQFVTTFEYGGIGWIYAVVYNGARYAYYIYSSCSYLIHEGWLDGKDDAMQRNKEYVARAKRMSPHTAKFLVA